MTEPSELVKKLSKLAPWLVAGLVFPALGQVGIGKVFNVKTMLCVSTPIYLVYLGLLFFGSIFGATAELTMSVTAKMFWDIFNLSAAVAVVLAWRRRKKGSN